MHIHGPKWHSDPLRLPNRKLLAHFNYEFTLVMTHSRAIRFLTLVVQIFYAFSFSMPHTNVLIPFLYISIVRVMSFYNNIIIILIYSIINIVILTHIILIYIINIINN